MSRPTNESPNARSELPARLRSSHATTRVTHTLLGVASDLVAPYASDYLSPDDYDWLSALIERPVESATESALATLAADLEVAIQRLDPASVARLKAIQRWRP